MKTLILHTVAALALLAGLAGPAVAADPAPPAEAVATRTYQTVQGDTLERVLQKTMGQSPLKMELLREALVQANPQVIPAGRNPRFKPGTVLMLPDHDALLRQAVMPLLQASELAAMAGPDARRRWVRFP